MPDLEVERELGRGGMGVVLLGTQRRLRRKVAIKILPARAIDEEDLLRFRREARTFAALPHPHLVKVFDADLTGEVAYIILELLEGQDLRERIRMGEHLDAGELGREVAGGLAYIHERGMLHRDIKPANIFICDDGRPVLMDFGLAKAAHADVTMLTASGAMVGTPAYMAPELFLGQAGTAAGDVYGLGMALLEVAAGRLLFVATGEGIACRNACRAGSRPSQGCGRAWTPRWRL